MLNVPEYITSVYQPFSAFDSVFGSYGNLAKTSGIIEKFNGRTPKRDNNNIPYAQTVNGVVKYTGTITKDPETGFYNNERKGWNGEAVLSIDDKLAQRALDNPYQ